ncbi:hypothetical protein [Actinophytocola sp.]|jgi:sigma-B regulation protein RsbQ|uniref:hypothetical protein n=1 Tax=Actinophytocola sp. TaxID=1872138 RepID=UPI002F950114
MVLAHGFGYDQDMWRLVVPVLEQEFSVALFDHVGAGRSDLFAGLVLLAPSLRFTDDPAAGYRGWFSEQDIDELLESPDANYLTWSAAMAPGDHGQPGPAGAGRETAGQLLPDTNRPSPDRSRE